MIMSSDVTRVWHTRDTRLFNYFKKLRIWYFLPTPPIYFFSFTSDSKKLRQKQYQKYRKIGLRSSYFMNSLEIIANNSL